MKNPILSAPVFEPINGIHTVFDAMQVLRKTCAAYDFRYFSVLALPNAIAGADLSISQIAMISSWPPELISEYDRLNLARNSPVLDQLRKQITPLLFEVDSINDDRPATESTEAKALFARFGLSMGVYFPVHDSQGVRHAVSLIGNREPLAVNELTTLAMFSTLLVGQLAQINSDGNTGKSVLSARETEVLQWTAEGKTSAEIARITGLSEHTVNHYATIATQKLGCSNRTQAVVSALRLGLFS
ncbi:LuxR family transcriptional regulator [Hoeflea sp. G2-23]|uniref:LuxR family transcriptional regulator n=1 Tax=Hoeflea algicola TaxID=2983763 RepID=A0ABT3Z8C7_9HYPH|nr:LuxR family transcriptional regulator [Hoeflea algicola]MCY0147946.1 LuxR family transcriptional regulator [Hoeflea algicola]